MESTSSVLLVRTPLSTLWKEILSDSRNENEVNSLHQIVLLLVVSRRKGVSCGGGTISV